MLSEPPARFSGRVANCSGTGLQIWTPQPVTPGAAVRVRLSDALWLGEASYCRAEGGAFNVGIRLEQTLNDLNALARLHRALLCEEEDSEPAAELRRGR